MRPSKDVQILTEELDERAFLFLGKTGTDGDGALWVCWVDLDFLRLLSRLECRSCLEVAYRRHTKSS